MSALCYLRRLDLLDLAPIGLLITKVGTKIPTGWKWQPILGSDVANGQNPSNPGRQFALQFTAILGGSSSDLDAVQSALYTLTARNPNTGQVVQCLYQMGLSPPIQVTVTNIDYETVNNGYLNDGTLFHIKGEIQLHEYQEQDTSRTAPSQREDSYGPIMAGQSTLDQGFVYSGCEAGIAWNLANQSLILDSLFQGGGLSWSPLETMQGMRVGQVTAFQLAPPGFVTPPGASNGTKIWT